MEFVASYWWLWLIGFLCCTGWSVWKFISSFFSIAGDAIEIAKTSVDSYNTVVDDEKNAHQKAGLIAQKAITKVSERGIDKVSKLFHVLVGFVGSWLFGILFLVSIVLNIIDYIKA